ncbi:MAG TPA: chemotaxis protein CheW [Geobacteraceae bacterium]|nr:chemotaxis protein CheW [Geobacteraceae bacterium]
MHLSTGVGDMHHMVGFVVGNEEFCVDILKVQEIIRMLEITKIPNAPEYAEGVINLRGRVIPVIDFRKRFNLPESSEDSNENRRIVVVDITGTTIGLIVDQVSHVIKLDGESVSPTPETVKNSAGGCFNGIGRVGEKLIILLDVEGMFDDGELDWVEKAA